LAILINSLLQVLFMKRSLLALSVALVVAVFLIVGGASLNAYKIQNLMDAIATQCIGQGSWTMNENCNGYGTKTNGSALYNNFQSLSASSPDSDSTAILIVIIVILLAYIFETRMQNPSKRKSRKSYHANRARKQ
jgi:hypothetical protein